MASRLRLSSALLGALALSCASGCGDGDAGVEPGQTCDSGDELRERHGTDCLCCHEELSVAGSIAGEGRARVLVRDARGVELAMTTNAYGNFFRHLDVTPPLEVTLVEPSGRARRMTAPAPHGSCNRCHGANTDLGPLTTERP